MAFGLSITIEHGVNSGLNERGNEFGSDSPNKSYVNNFNTIRVYCLLSKKT